MNEKKGGGFEISALPVFGIRNRKVLQGFVGILVFVVFVFLTLQSVQALQQLAGYYGYYNGTYGYNSATTSSDYLPSAPTNFTLGARSANQIAFTWTAPTTTTGSTSLDNLSNYTVAYGTGTISACTDGSQTTATTASATLTSLNAGTTYNIAICVNDTNGNTSSALTGSMTTSSSGSGGGGGGGSSATPAPAPAPATPAPVAAPAPAAPSAEPTPAVVATKVAAVSVGAPAAVSVGGASHTVTVSLATATEATMTIESDPVTINIKKDQSVDVDTDGNGINDLRVTYNGLNADGKPEFTFAALATTLTCTMPSGMGTSPVTGAPEAISAVKAGDFIKSAGFSTVYYVTTTCGRRVFMDSQTYFTWTSDFNRVKNVTDATLSALSLQGIMLPKHNVVLVKIQSDPKVYAVTESAASVYKPALRWVASEAVAKSLYGTAWADYVIDVPATLFPRFTFGDAVLDAASLTVDRNLLKKRVNLK